MNIRAEEIILSSAKPKQTSGKPQTFCEIFRFQPDNMEQVPLGNLYIVAQLTSVKDCGHLSNLLASLIKREYYLYPEHGAIRSFQIALKKANNHLNDLAKQGNCEWLGKLHFVCAAIFNDELFFAQAGNTKILLYREGSLTNLGKKAITEPDKPQPGKIFSSIVSGKIEENDKIIMATPALEEIISLNGLKQLIASQADLAALTDHINKLLREQKDIRSIAMLLMQAEDDPLPQTNLTQPASRKMTTEPIDLNDILK